MESEHSGDSTLFSEKDSDSNDINSQLQSDRNTAEESGNQRPVVFVFV